MIFHHNALGALLVSLAVLLEARSVGRPRSPVQTKDVDSNGGNCKAFPGDRNWPDATNWSSLNQTVKGQLIGTAPIAAVCHSGPRYDAAACRHVNADYTTATLHYMDPTSIMTPWFAGNSCIPTADPSLPCTQGGFPTFVINATGPSDIQTGINFARENSIRLVIKNTGHDFLGKSAGAGALSIWTHNLKDVQFFEHYNKHNWTGAAIKAQTGVQAKELYAAAKKYGVTCVGGEGATVGVVGGFVLGGGHSPLSSLYGTGADHVLEMEVVTADGKLVVANAEENADLFWALSGSGPSAFGVVTSITLQAYPVLSATGVTFDITTGPNLSLETFWSAMRDYFSYLVTWAEAGTYHYSTLYPTSDGFQFRMAPFFAPNKSVAETNALLAPWYAQLTALGISVNPNITGGNNFYDAWSSSFALETAGNVGQLGSRLFPRQNFADSSSDIFNRTFDAIKASSDDGNAFLGFNMAPTLKAGGHKNNSVNPHWRNTVLHALSNAPWNTSTPASEIKLIREQFTKGPMQKWRDVSPGSGAYLNEAMLTEPNWQDAFYGSNYPRLSEIKRKWDPIGVFYAITAVGSENWVVNTPDGLPTANGRLCRK